VRRSRGKGGNRRTAARERSIAASGIPIKSRSRPFDVTLLGDSSSERAGGILGVRPRFDSGRATNQQKTAGRPGGRPAVSRPGSAGTLEEPLELPAPDGMLQLSDRLGLDLADPLAGDLEDPAHLFEGVGVAVAQAVAE